MRRRTRGMRITHRVADDCPIRVARRAPRRQAASGRRPAIGRHSPDKLLHGGGDLEIVRHQLRQSGRGTGAERQQSGIAGQRHRQRQAGLGLHAGGPDARRDRAGARGGGRPRPARRRPSAGGAPRPGRTATAPDGGTGRGSRERPCRARAPARPRAPCTRAAARPAVRSGRKSAPTCAAARRLPCRVPHRRPRRRTLVRQRQPAISLGGKRQRRGNGEAQHLGAGCVPPTDGARSG